MTHDYGLSTSILSPQQNNALSFEAYVDSTDSTLRFRILGADTYGKVTMYSSSGEALMSTMGDFLAGEWVSRDLPDVPSGMYVVQLEMTNGAKAVAQIMIVR